MSMPRFRVHRHSLVILLLVLSAGLWAQGKQREACEQFLAWVKPLQEEFPDLDDERLLYARAIPLYSEQHYPAAFGFGFGGPSPAGREELYENLLQCASDRKLGTMITSVPQYASLMAGLHENSRTPWNFRQVAFDLSTYRGAYRVYERALKRLDPANASIPSQYVNEARQLLQPPRAASRRGQATVNGVYLWPSQRRRLSELIDRADNHQQRARMNRMLADLAARPQDADAAESVLRILDDRVFTDLLDKVYQEEVRTRLLTTRANILEPRVAAQRASLEGIGDGPDGLAAYVAWYATFWLEDMRLVESNPPSRALYQNFKQRYTTLITRLRPRLTEMITLAQSERELKELYDTYLAVQERFGDTDELADVALVERVNKRIKALNDAELTSEEVAARDKKERDIANENRRYNNPPQRSEWLDTLDTAPAAQAAAQGTVYREWEYWHRYAESGSRLARIFHGKWRQDKLTDNVDQHLYTLFHKFFYTRCKDQVPADSPGFELVETTTITNGPFRDTYENGRTRFLIRREYYPHYQEMAAATDNFNWNDPYTMVKFLYGLNQDMDLLFATEGCATGFVHQLEDNFLRYADGRAPVQSEPTASNYLADDTTAPSGGTDFFKACVRNDGGFYATGSWCRCLEKNLKPLLGPESRRQLVGDFAGFMQQLVRTPAQGDTKAWALYEQYAGCVACKNSGQQDLIGCMSY